MSRLRGRAANYNIAVQLTVGASHIIAFGVAVRGRFAMVVEFGRMQPPISIQAPAPVLSTFS
jgi:hypothetical protein